MCDCAIPLARNISYKANILNLIKGKIVIVNLTQHPATPEQAAVGVVDLKGEKLVVLKKLLTFNRKPAIEEIHRRAEDVADLCGHYCAAMIGGAPYFMSALEGALKAEGIKTMYAFSERVSVEASSPDGTVTKTNVFKHAGFVEV